MVHLDEAAVRAVLTWGTLIPAMETALSAFSAGRVIQPCLLYTSDAADE